MANLQEVFIRIRTAKRTQRDLRAAYRDALASTKSYQDLKEQLDALKEKKKMIEKQVQQDFRSELAEIDKLKDSITTDQVLLADLAMNTITKGERIAVTDENAQEYEPIFSVRFKKKE